MSKDPRDVEIVNFPVPKPYLPVVIRALAEAMEAASSPSSRPPLPPSQHNEWTRDEIRQLKRELRNQMVLLLLTLTAERAGEWVSFDEVREKAGRTLREAMGDLAGFSQFVKRFGKAGQEEWPVETKWGTPTEGPTRYRMQPNIAQWWQEA